MMHKIMRLAVGGVLLAGGSLPARAVPLDVPSSPTPYNSVTSDGLTFTLLQCTRGGVACGSGVGTFAALGEGGTAGIVITGPNGTPPLQSANNYNSVDTFLQFAITSPIQSVAALSAIITGCGGNTEAPGCAATTYYDESTTTVYISTSTVYNNPANQLVNPLNANLDFENVNPSSNKDSGYWTFSSQAPGNTIYITMDLSTTSAGGYASFDSIVLAVSEPASGAVFAFCLAGLAALRRSGRGLVTIRSA